MKGKESLLLVSIAMVIIFSLFSVPALAGGDTVTFEGTMMKFPKGDQIPDLDLSGITFDLASLPPDAKFMAGKVYKGEYKPIKRKGAYGNLVTYVFATGGTDEGFSLSLSQTSGSRLPAGHHKLHCPSSAFTLSDLSCKREDDVACRLSNKKGQPVLYCEGVEMELQEIAILPDEVLKK